CQVYLYCGRLRRDLHSFPTRRSSDLIHHRNLNCTRLRCKLFSMLDCFCQRLSHHHHIRTTTEWTFIHAFIVARRIIARIDAMNRSEEHTSELQSRENLVCRLLLEKKK